MNIKKYYEGAIKPFTFADKEFLRWYTKHANNLEKKGKSIEKINLKLSATYILSNFISISSAVQPTSNFIKTYNTSKAIFEGADISRNYHEFEKPSIKTDTTLAENPAKYIHKKITSPTRLLILMWGAYNTIKGISDVYNYFAHSENPNWTETTFNLSTGIEHLALASSIYFKARNPKLLDKEPAWKDAINSAKIKLEEIISPPPEPLSIKTNNSIEATYK